MSTRRGPKVEPHDNPRLENFEVVVDKLPEMPKAQVFEEVHEKEQSEPVDFTGEDLIAEDEFITSEEAKVPHFEFQKDYFLGTPSESANKQTVIDPLPQPKKRKKTMDELNQTELRMYQKTGFLPEI